ncbi:MAG: NADH:flavin oxidoreductase/NADH oxidase [Alphaproteobacteria bacterium]|nr:NADH:flavin oxidoreductase/NADH oxidase [Alphaproteobacteria bacterium]
MPEQPHLFSPLKIRNLVLRNRIGVSPMCQYSSEDGFVNDWHFAHLGSRAVGGAGLVMMEATNVSPEGRITPACTGLWKDAHIEPLWRITDFIKKQGAAAGVQLGHAGRKASMQKPWEGGKRLSKDQGGWETLAPSALPFSPELEPPKEMSGADIQKFIADFVSAAERAVRAGFQIIELHGAHGYLLHEFLSPLSNKRADSYGGSLENRCRLTLEIAGKIRKVIPQEIVLGARLSCVDWLEGGITIDDSAHLAQELKKRGVDFIDCSSGFISAAAKSPFAPGFQVPFAKEIREKTGILTCAVGLITEAEQADGIIRSGGADMVFLARAMLRDPYWPIHAAQKLNQKAEIPPQYLRGY